VLYVFVVAFAVNDVKLRNVALNKPSWQVSTWKDKFGEHPANLANDGYRQTRVEVTEKSCAVAMKSTNPWWVVDLEKPTLVASVQLTNRNSYGSSLALSL